MASEEVLSESSKDLQQRYEALGKLKLDLDMTRGQPSSEQYELANPLISILKETDFESDSGVDCRNYPGGIFGLQEAREYFSKILGVSSEETLVANNSSLSLMSDVLHWLMLRGAAGIERPWCRSKVKMICPVPGYDRHFTICEALGIEMIPVRLGEHGPNIDELADIVRRDDSVKALITVPQYNNPTGCTFSDEIVVQLAGLPAKADDFTIFWDNAYAVHDLTAERQRVKNLLACCKDLKVAERCIMFSSTSKITFAGAGLGFMAASEKNLKYFGKLMSSQSIGPDKFNQLRHLRFLAGVEGGLEGHMARQAELLKPKFEAVISALDKELSGTELANWTNPKGGYFISLDVPKGKAKRVVELAAGLGVKLTAAGATYPGGVDPEDRNIRIAPSRPPLADVEKAAEVLAVCVKLAAAE